MKRDDEKLIKESRAELKALKARHRGAVAGPRPRLLRLLKEDEVSSVEQAARLVNHSCLETLVALH